MPEKSRGEMNVKKDRSLVNFMRIFLFSFIRENFKEHSSIRNIDMFVDKFIENN